MRKEEEGREGEGRGGREEGRGGKGRKRGGEFTQAARLNERRERNGGGVVVFFLISAEAALPFPAPSPFRTPAGGGERRSGASRVGRAREKAGVVPQNPLVWGGPNDPFLVYKPSRGLLLLWPF
jgi:hypothetical protein